MRIELTTQRTETEGRARSAVFLTLVVGAALAALVALMASTAREAEAAFTEKIVFVSQRTTGTGVDNPTGDHEIFTMNPDGTGVKQLTFNTVSDFEPTLSPDGTKVAYQSSGIQDSNPEGDYEIYRINTQDGTDPVNLTNNGSGVDDYAPVFSPSGTKIAYASRGIQPSNPEGDFEVFSMNAVDGLGKKNLSNNGVKVSGSTVVDGAPDFSPDGTKVAYQSSGIQASNPEGDGEVFSMNAVDGSGKKNLTNNGSGVDDYAPVFSPDGQKIAYMSEGAQTSNPEGDLEVYRVNTLDGTGKKNLSNNGSGVRDRSPVFSPGGKKIAYFTYGKQSSNPEGDDEVYLMNTLDGTGKKNLTNNAADVYDYDADFSPDGTKVSYTSEGAQTSNPEGDLEVYRLNVLDGTGKQNLSNGGGEDSSSEWGG